MDQNLDNTNNLQEKFNSLIKKNKIKLYILIATVIFLIFSFFLLQEYKKKIISLFLKNISKQLFFYLKEKIQKQKII